MTPRVLVAGYLSLDTIETPSLRSSGVPGGAALYAALGALQAGAHVAIVARVGRDYPTAWLTTLAEARIDVSGITRADGPSRRAHLVHVRDGGRRSPAHADPVWRERTAALAPIAPSRLDDVDMLVLAPMPLAGMADWLAAAYRRAVPVVADTSAAFIADGGRELTRLLPRLAVFAPSLEETRLMMPRLDDDTAAASLAASGCAIVQKRGADGLVAIAAGSDPVRIPAREGTVVDPTGAGDATVGRLAASLARGASLADAARDAVAAGAAAISALGPSAFLTFPDDAPAQAVPA